LRNDHRAGRGLLRAHSDLADSIREQTMVTSGSAVKVTVSIGVATVGP